MGHRPFIFNLDKFKCADSNRYECGEVGTATHAYVHCTLTKRWNMKLSKNPLKENCITFYQNYYS